MKYHKKELLALAKRIEQASKITPSEIEYILNFRKKDQPKRVTQILKKSAVPLSLGFGSFFTMFPQQFQEFTRNLPSWTNLSPITLTGVDYIWNLIGDPVGKANIMYHIPNVILYSFGIFGVKKLFDAIEKRNWLDRVYAAQKTLQNSITQGNTNFLLKKGASLLFIGKGDFIGMQFVLNHKPDQTVTLSEAKPHYTSIWNYFNSETIYDDLKKVLIQSDAQHAGEYIFFPVKDDQIFLPAPSAYDVSPHKLDIICQDIRTIEKELKWKQKRIIIVGDRFHKSFVQSEDKRGVLRNSEDTISLESISEKYSSVTLLDPTDIVLQKIIDIAKGRKIVFRATTEGISEYKLRFYSRLELLGYRVKKGSQGVLTIGYDLFEDQTEQQMLSRKIDDYFPVVLSKNVHDALIRNGYKKSEFLYVPEIVLSVTTKAASQQ